VQPGSNAVFRNVGGTNYLDSVPFANPWVPSYAAAWNFAITNEAAAATSKTLTNDGAWHNLHLGGILPAGVKLVFGTMQVHSRTAQAVGRIAPTASTNTGYAVYQVVVPVANIFSAGMFAVPVDTRTNIAYRLDTTVTTGRLSFVTGLY
jgi:hypothetical protein